MGHLPENICPFHLGGACSFPCNGKGESIQTWSLWFTDPIEALPAGSTEEGMVWKAHSLGVVVNGRGKSV